MRLQVGQRMYIRDQASSELDWAGAYGQGRTGLGATIGADTHQQVRDAGKAPYRWICASDLFFPYICYRPAVDTAGGVLTERVSSGGKVCISMIAH
jgi:hypothetical protein